MGQKKVKLTTEFWVDKEDGYGLVHGTTTGNWEGPQNWHRLMLEILGMCEFPRSFELAISDVGEDGEVTIFAELREIQ